MSSKKDGRNQTSTRKLLSTLSTNSKQKNLDRKNPGEKNEITKDVAKLNKDKKTKFGTTLESQTVAKESLTKAIIKETKIQNANTGNSRVSKSVFFPSKTMYKNALEAKAKPTKNVPSYSKSLNNNIPDKNITPSGRQKYLEKKSSNSSISSSKRHSELPSTSRNRINVEQPSEIKLNVAKSIQSSKKTSKEECSDTSEMSERPRTATLRKGSIVNGNIVGPDIPLKKQGKTSKPYTPNPTSEDTEVTYEDDFESYESDFEEYSSSTSKEDDISAEETSSVSSEEESDQVGALELKSSVTKLTTPLNIYEERLDSGNYHMPENIPKIPLNLKKYLNSVNSAETDLSKNNPASLSDEGFEDQKSLQFLNFLDAKKRYEAEEKANLRHKRGEHILSMIKLDKVNFTLFSLPSVPYDIFIKTYGRRNTIQSATQTGEDNVDDETQTDFIQCISKGTQYPTSLLTCDASKTVNKENISAPYDEYSLDKFILSAGKLILQLQKESLPEKDKNKNDNGSKIPFGDDFLSRIFNEISEVRYSSFFAHLNSSI